MKMSEALKRALYLIVGVLITMHVVYVRFVITRIPKELILINPINYKLIWIVSIGMLSSIFMLYKSINIIEAPTTPSITQNFLNKINQVITEALDSTYNFILIKLVTKPYDLGSAITRRFYALFSKITEKFFVIVPLIIKATILLIFLIDVFYFNKLDYFYKSLMLLSILPIISVLFYTLDQVASNKDIILNYIQVKEIQHPVTKEALLGFKPMPGYEQYNMSYFIEEYALCSKVQRYLALYKEYNSYYQARFNIFLYSFYLVGWFYILYINHDILRLLLSKDNVHILNLAKFLKCLLSIKPCDGNPFDMLDM